MSADRLKKTKAGIWLSFELPGCYHAGRVIFTPLGWDVKKDLVTKLRLVIAAALGPFLGEIPLEPFIRPRSTIFNIVSGFCCGGDF
jgi:hypothetical protein